MKYVLFYDSADDIETKAPLHFPAHQARLQEFHGRGTLLMVGAFANPQEEGSMAIFTTREAAEDFVAGDPFVHNGVVSNWRIQEWNEALGDPTGAMREEPSQGEVAARAAVTNHSDPTPAIPSERGR